MGLFFNHDASGLKDAVDECHRLFRTALHDGSLMVHDARNVMAVLFGVIFTGSTERRGRPR